jgi:3-hydroxybutyrate dehydrogenase
LTVFKILFLFLEFVEPENLGAFAVFISSDAAKQINGANLSMDVGWTTR